MDREHDQFHRLIQDGIEWIALGEVNRDGNPCESIKRFDWPKIESIGSGLHRFGPGSANDRFGIHLRPREVDSEWDRLDSGSDPPTTGSIFGFGIHLRPQEVDSK